MALALPAGSTMQDLVQKIELPLDEKGITFINRQLSDMPGLGADLERVLAKGDRVAIFHTKSMWPYQYRDDAAATPELKKAMQARDGGLHHRYNE